MKLPGDESQLGNLTEKNGTLKLNRVRRLSIQSEVPPLDTIDKSYGCVSRIRQPVGNFSMRQQFDYQYF